MQSADERQETPSRLAVYTVAGLTAGTTDQPAVVRAARRFGFGYV